MILNRPQWPSVWRRAPLWTLFRRVKDTGHPGEVMLSVYRDHGVVKKDDRADNYNKTAENRNIYQLVGPGWLAVNRMKAWQGAVGISGYRGILSGHYICFRPLHAENSRFLNWLLRSEPYRYYYSQISRGVRPSQSEIDNDDLRTLAVYLPPIGDQRRIADFLDGEVARIDQLIAVRAAQQSVLNERHDAAIYNVIASEAEAQPWVQLRRLGVGVTTGPFGTSFSADEYQAGGVPMINPTNIRDGGLVPSMNHAVSPATAQRLRRHQLNEGDLVVSRKGDLGRSARVNADQRGWICGSDCIALHSDESKLDSQFLDFMLRASFTRAQLLENSLAATMPSLSEGNLLQLKIPNLSLADQKRLVKSFDAIAAWKSRAYMAMSQQVSRLQERRQALGEFSRS